MLNAVLVGRCGRPPEIKDAGGHVLCSVSVAADSGFGDKKVTTWVTVQLWGKDGENAHKRLDKGTLLEVSGELKEESWSGQDGAKKSKLVLMARSWRVLADGAQRQDETDGYGEPRPAGRPAKTSQDW